MLPSEQPRIRKQNKRLADLGVNPYGEPLYKWVKGEELAFRKLALSGYSAVVSAAGLHLPQYKPVGVQFYPALVNLWLVGKWIQYDPEGFHRAFGREYVYPERGSYQPTEFVCPAGVEPTHALTSVVIARVKNIRDTPWKQVLEELSPAKEDERIAKPIREAVRARLDNALGITEKPGTHSTSREWGGVRDVTLPGDTPRSIKPKEHNENPVPASG